MGLHAVLVVPQRPPWPLGARLLAPSCATHSGQPSRAGPNGRLRCSREGRAKVAHPTAFCTPRRSDPNPNPKSNPNQAERVKVALNDECDCAGHFYDGDEQATVEVQLPPSLQAAAPLSVTRAEYEKVTAELFERALIPVRQARRALRHTRATPPPHLHHTSATRTRQRRYGSGGDRGATAVVVAESPVGSGWHG